MSPVFVHLSETVVKFKEIKPGDIFIDNYFYSKDWMVRINVDEYQGTNQTLKEFMVLCNRGKCHGIQTAINAIELHSGILRSFHNYEEVTLVGRIHRRTHCG